MTAYDFIFKGQAFPVVGFGATAETSNLMPLVSRTLAIVLVGTIVGIFVLLFMDKPVPDALIGIVGAIIGYFGGCLVSYANILPKEPEPVVEIKE